MYCNERFPYSHVFLLYFWTNEKERKLFECSYRFTEKEFVPLFNTIHSIITFLLGEDALREGFSRT